MSTLTLRNRERVKCLDATGKSVTVVTVVTTGQGVCTMPAMNIRDISPELIRKLKAIALIEGRTLRDTVIGILDQHVVTFDIGTMSRNNRKKGIKP